MVRRCVSVGIARDKVHKRRKTGGKQVIWRKKRKFELGRPAAMTRIGEKRIRSVRVRGYVFVLSPCCASVGNVNWPWSFVEIRRLAFGERLRTSVNCKTYFSLAAGAGFVMTEVTPSTVRFESTRATLAGVRRPLLARPVSST